MNRHDVYRFIATEKTSYPVRLLGRLLGVVTAPSTNGSAAANGVRPSVSSTTRPAPRRPAQRGLSTGASMAPAA